MNPIRPALVVLAAACGARAGTEVGNGALIHVVASGEAGDPRIDRARATFDQARATACGGAATVLLDTEVPTDLASDDATQLAVLPPGSWCRLDLDLAALAIEAQRADGTPVALSAADLVVRVDLAAALDAGRFEDGLLLAFDRAAWLAGVDLDAADRIGGAIRIDATSNPTLLADVADRFASSASLHHDADGDLLLDPGERAAALGRGRPGGAPDDEDTEDGEDDDDDDEEEEDDDDDG